MVYKRIDFRREWYTKGWILDGSGIQKDRFETGVVYKRTDFRRDDCFLYVFARKNQHRPLTFIGFCTYLIGLCTYLLVKKVRTNYSNLFL